LCQFLDVTLVPGAWRGLFVPDQLVKADERYFDTAVLAAHHIRFGVVVRDAIDLVDEVHTRRDHAERQDVARREECVERQVAFRKAERDQSVTQTDRVLFRGPEEDIDVLGKPGMAVSGNRVASHDHVVNPVFFE